MKDYIDGFVIPVPKDRLNDYERIATLASQVWLEHGALEYRECVGDDLEIPDMLSFSKIANAAANETVVFAWITYRSREHRDEVNAKVMADPRMQEMGSPGNMPFDCKRMAYGGFRTLIYSSNPNLS